MIIDRSPWLERLHSRLLAAERDRWPTVLTCSALKRRYRESLTSGLTDVRIIICGSQGI
jgi:gluconate kinase